ncbi:ovarian-specific serine/threonine-protein kinase lok-related [Holotrichia oblita]|uniref:Ovarian-specific serine/threonine-protein kinase lok-related n=1 Tax=Holotrichia oblita TaxID=644536 RepID=A0ACB9SSZ0_HOLOL|nr:ovarian-specific serine/threonine-protein kinase lok-related [Holotrichia oblita]
MSDISQLPSTLTPADADLTPRTASLILNPGNTWGRLFPTLSTLLAYDLNKASFKLGKTESCDCVLSTDTFIKTKLDNISREHFIIKKEDDKPIYIQDLSKNGTFLNGEKIGRKKKRILQNDDAIAIGYQRLKVFIYKTFENAVDDFLPPSLQRKYYLSRLLGRGACGEVKLIFDKESCRPYAVKRIIKARSSKIFDMNHVKFIQKEIKILREMAHHPFIVKIHDVEETPDAFFLAMEYMEGGVLTDAITERRIPENEVKYFFYQILLAVSYLHDNGIIHRDIKADNILLKEKDNPNTIVKISDFGLAKILEQESVANTRCGTPNYIAPEILDKNKIFYDRKVDIWSMGVLLYLMLSQELPFIASDISTLNKLIKKGRYSMKKPIWDEISTEAKDLIQKMLNISPEERIHLEVISDHPWIDQDKSVQQRVNDMYDSLTPTMTLDLEETIIQPAKRRRLDNDEDDDD